MLFRSGLTPTEILDKFEGYNSSWMYMNFDGYGNVKEWEGIECELEIAQWIIENENSLCNNDIEALLEEMESYVNIETLRDLLEYVSETNYLVEALEILELDCDAFEDNIYIDEDFDRLANLLNFSYEIKNEDEILLTSKENPSRSEERRVGKEC